VLSDNHPRLPPWPPMMAWMTNRALCVAINLFEGLLGLLRELRCSKLLFENGIGGHKCVNSIHICNTDRGRGRGE
jgi:hypothetical protein